MPVSKISNELSAMIRDKQKISPDEKVPVIITLNKGVSLDDAKNKFSKMGLGIENIIPEPIPVIAGSISVKNISQLAEASEVKIIEYDSKVYAL